MRGNPRGVCVVLELDNQVERNRWASSEVPDSITSHDILFTKGVGLTVRCHEYAAEAEYLRAEPSS